MQAHEWGTDVAALEPAALEAGGVALGCLEFPTPEPYEIILIVYPDPKLQSNVIPMVSSHVSSLDVITRPLFPAMMMVQGYRLVR